MMGSTSNALDKGGDNFKNLYYESDVTKRNRNGQTSSGLYSLFIPMEWNYEGYIDMYGIPTFETPNSKTYGPDGYEIKIGVIDYSSYFGKLVKQILDVTEFVILKTVDQDSLLWPQER